MHCNAPLRIIEGKRWNSVLDVWVSFIAVVRSVVPKIIFARLNKVETDSCGTFLESYFEVISEVKAREKVTQRGGNVNHYPLGGR